MQHINDALKLLGETSCSQKMLDFLTELNKGDPDLRHMSKSIQSVFDFFKSGRVFRRIADTYRTKGYYPTEELMKFYWYMKSVPRETVDGGALSIKVRASVDISNLNHDVLIHIDDVKPQIEMLFFGSVFLVREKRSTYSDIPFAEWYKVSGARIMEMSGLNEVWKVSKTRVYAHRWKDDFVVMHDVRENVCSRINRKDAPKSGPKTPFITDYALRMTVTPYQFLVDTRPPGFSKPLDNTYKFDKNTDLLRLESDVVSPKTLMPIFPYQEAQLMTMAGDFVLFLVNRSFFIYNRVTDGLRAVPIPDSMARRVVDINKDYVCVDTRGRVYMFQMTNLLSESTTSLNAYVNVEDEFDKVWVPISSGILKFDAMNTRCYFKNDQFGKVKIYSRHNGEFLKEMYFEQTDTAMYMYSEHYIRSKESIFDPNIQNKTRLGTLANVYSSSFLNVVAKYIFY